MKYYLHELGYREYLKKASNSFGRQKSKYTKTKREEDVVKNNGELNEAYAARVNLKKETPVDKSIIRPVAIGDKVTIVDGVFRGSDGTIVNIISNKLGDFYSLDIRVWNNDIKESERKKITIPTKCCSVRPSMVEVKDQNFYSPGNFYMYLEMVLGHEKAINQSFYNQEKEEEKDTPLFVKQSNGPIANKKKGNWGLLQDIQANMPKPIDVFWDMDPVYADPVPMPDDLQP